jgi:ribosomal protein S18 acetylase RimI-like enzyme
MDYIIREITEQDLPNLVVLCQHHAAYEQAHYDPKGKKIALKRALFARKPRLFCHVVEVENKIVGYASYTFDFSTWDAQTFLYMDCLYLESDFRGFGIGEQMMLKITEIARQNKCVNVQWQTPDFNEKAIRFYKRIGGKSKGKVRFFIVL